MTLIDNASSHLPDRWTTDQAHAWYDKRPFMYGANYITSDASNQIEMWQDATFNPVLIEREMRLMQELGMNVNRVFAHDIPHRDDPAAFKRNLDTYLGIADRYDIETLLVLFDSVWAPLPQSGPQPEVPAGLHNGGWVQSPGMDALSDPSHYGRLRGYVEDMTKTYGTDKRVLGIDLWNEPDNLNVGSYNDTVEKWNYVAPLLQDSFTWARKQGPDKPLTSGVWTGYRDEPLHPIFKIQLENSDVISFHDYAPVDVFLDNARHLQDTYGRPLMCTEYMARTLGSRFETHLPTARENKITMFSWGFVQGKSQTHCAWDSWGKHHAGEPCQEPDEWFHDIFRENGAFYCEQEKQFFMGFKGNDALTA